MGYLPQPAWTPSSDSCSPSSSKHRNFEDLSLHSDSVHPRFSTGALLRSGLECYGRISALACQKRVLVMGAEQRSAFVQLDKDVSFQREWGARCHWWALTNKCLGRCAYRGKQVHGLYALTSRRAKRQLTQQICTRPNLQGYIVPFQFQFADCSEYWAYLVN